MGLLKPKSKFYVDYEYILALYVSNELYPPIVSVHIYQRFRYFTPSTKYSSLNNAVNGCDTRCINYSNHKSAMHMSVPKVPDWSAALNQC